MTTYILGAGASCHAGYPLASHLWKQMRDWMCGNKPEGEWGRSCVEELNLLYGNLTNFEQILTELDECPSGSPAARLDKTHLGNLRGNVRRCVPEYFDGIRQRPSPLYERFASERIQTNDVIITFNYDLACERALKAAGRWEISDGYGFQTGVSAAPSSNVTVLKLHGSTNWCWPLFEGRRPGGLSQMSGFALPDKPAIRCREDLEFLGYPTKLFEPLRQSTSSGVVSAVIMGRKRFYVETLLGGREGAEFWDCLWSQAEDAIARSEKIAIIGYSMPAADEEARELLLEKANRRTSISVCCGENSKDIRDKFKGHGFDRVNTPGNGFFEDYLEC